MWLCLCKQKTAYEMRISDWSSDVCSSDLTRTEVQKHAFLSLMENPNPLMDFCEFVETSVQHYDTAGEFIWVLSHGSIRAAGPLQVWPVRPDRMRVVTSDTEALTGYVYVGPDGERVPLLVEDRKSTRLNSSH